MSPAPKIRLAVVQIISLQAEVADFRLELPKDDLDNQKKFLRIEDRISEIVTELMKEDL